MKETKYIGKNGFTLIELIVALSLISLVFIAGGSIYKSGVKSYQVNDELIELNEKSELLKMRISQELRQSGNGLIELILNEVENSEWPNGKMREQILNIQTYAYSRDSDSPDLVQITYKLIPLVEKINRYKLIRINENGNTEVLVEEIKPIENEAIADMISIKTANYYMVNFNFDMVGKYVDKIVDETITVRGR
ncbi:MAG: prepilin-type N-terminal cleavage/methylation domain-containing protein [Tissierellales bacterium]|jgi:prepilin-type N-terminal cleavage/methylation domain-containing protein|nr:prepilin-type N-terminal cleavage/methylation domain-containing protein [Tissierellales bacterium]